MSVLTGWRAALRIARRDALRAKGRSALVISMIALPVLGVTAADITFHSATSTRAEQLNADMGAADALFRDPGMGAGPIEQMPEADGYGALSESGDSSSVPDMAAALPPGARGVTEQSVLSTVTTKYGVKTLQVTELDTADPLVRGKITLLRGSFPESDSEMVANDAFLKTTGLHVGSHTTVRGAGKTFTITGAVELPADLKSDQVYVNTGALIAPWKDAAAHHSKILPPRPGAVDMLVKAADASGVTWRNVLAANKKGVLVKSREVFRNPPPRSEVPMADEVSGSSSDSTLQATAALATVVTMAMLEIVLLAGPAFAVGARRSRRQLGLVGTCGGDRKHIRAVVLCGGVVLGGAGAVIGTLAGLGLTTALRPLIEGWTGRRFGSLVVPPSELLGIAAIGLLTGLLAAFAPAIVAGRQSVLESLTGRRGVRRSSRVLPVLGVIALGLGIALAITSGLTGRTTGVAAGSVVAELGVLACIPVIVGFLGRLGRFFPLAPRLALRDAARNRGRTAPAVAAVMAAVAGTVAIATYTASTEAEQRYNHELMMPPGVIALVADTYTDQADPAKDLATARRIAAHDLPVAGAPAGIGRVWAGSDCDRFPDADSTDCGTLTMTKPPTHICPLQAKGGKELAAGLSADGHKRLLNSPSCKASSPTMVNFGNPDEIVVGDAALLRTYVGLKDPAAAKALAAGTPVLLNNAFADSDGEITINAVQRYVEQDKKQRQLHPGKPEKTMTRLKVYRAADRFAATPGIRLILPQSTADRLGLHSGPIATVYPVTHTPTDAENQHFDEGMEQAGGGEGTYLLHDTPPADDNSTMLMLTLFAGVVTLGAAAITTGLAKADAEADLTTLSAIGAPPGVRRTLSGFQCAVVAGTGVLLGAVTGVVPAVAVRLTDLRQALETMRHDPMQSSYTPIVLPWETVGILALGVPLLAGLLAGAFTRSRLVLARRAG